MEKKIYTEKTECGQRIVIDYGTHKTVVDVEDSDKSGMGGDRIYVSHQCKNGDIVDLTRVTKDDESYIAEILWCNDFAEYSEVFMIDDIDEDWGEE